MTLAAALLSENALRVDQQGVALEIGLNWYRSLPLSAVETLEVSIDGRAIPRGDIRFAINGRTHTLDELHELWDEEWFVLDTATLRFEPPRPLVAGQRVEVTVKLGNRIPYILIGGDRTLEYVSELSRRLIVDSQAPRQGRSSEARV